MKKLIQLVMVSLLLTTAPLSFAAKNNFQFQINNYHTQRQAGQTFDFYVRYAMKDDVDYTQYPDYRELRSIVMSYFEPTDALPINTYWEIIAAKLADDLMSRYPLAGISVQLLVHDNEKGTIAEPSDHGPIYTVGDVIPLNQTGHPSK